MFELYLIRHGESETNATPDVIGQDSNVKLTENGKFQAGLLKKRLTCPPDRVYSSSYVRALETAKIVFPTPREIAKIRIVDELREYKDEDAWSSMRYTMMAAQNPQVWIYSNAGDQHSVILNKLRERALASATTNDPIGWFEWSAEPDAPINLPSGEINWKAFAQANPSLGHTIHPDNLKAVINDPPDIVRTEVLCQWVDTINSAIDAQKWQL